jgi:hypothetical protein
MPEHEGKWKRAPHVSMREETGPAVHFFPDTDPCRLARQVKQFGG